MRLVYTTDDDTGKEVAKGDSVELRDGEMATVESFEKPHHPGSTGRVYVKTTGGRIDSYFPSVIGAEWIEREDR